MSRAGQIFNWLGMNQVQTPILLPDPMKSPCRTLCNTQVTQQQLARQQESCSVYVQPLLQAHKGYLSVHSSCRKNLETQVINCSSPKSWFPPKSCFVLFCMGTGSQDDFYFFFLPALPSASSISPARPPAGRQIIRRPAHRGRECLTSVLFQSQ